MGKTKELMLIKLSNDYKLENENNVFLFLTFLNLPYVKNTVKCISYVHITNFLVRIFCKYYFLHSFSLIYSYEITRKPFKYPISLFFMMEVIIFDWGGVLTVGKHTSGIARLLSKEYKLKDVYLKLGPLMKFIDNDDISFNEFCVKVNLIFNINISTTEMANLFARAIVPNKTVIKLLEKLKKNYRLLLLSNNNSTTIKILKSEHPDMLSSFEKCYFSSELGMRKPKKEIFEFVIKDSNLTPENCIFIDDKEKNIKTASKLGIQGIWFKRNSDINGMF